MKRILLLLTLVLLVGCSSEYDRTLSTNGVATTTVEPDEMQVTFAIETLSDSAQESKDLNAQKLSAVLEALKDAGIEDSAIETSYFNLYEEFDWTEDGRKSKGFKASHTLTVESNDLTVAGSIIDAAVNAGATRVQGVSFTLSQQAQEDVRSEVIAKAAQNARSKAQALADGSGSRLGKLVSISDQNYNYYPYRAYDYASAQVSIEDSGFEKTTISPKSLEISANVQAVYAIR